jgi:lipopolysaccharide export system protein LptA
MVGSLITYENTTDVFTVDGGAASPRPGGRVRAVLAPREGASAPARPSTPPAQLRPAPGISGETR